MSRVFLVSDDQPTIEAVTAVLAELEGFEDPVVLSSGTQARIESGRLEPDLLLVDEKCDGGQGMVVARELLLAFPLLPTCLLASNSDATLLAAAMDTGVRAVLPLPPSVEQYAERLRSALAWSRSIQGGVEHERVERARSMGRIVAVVGSKGGVGTSLVALAGARVCATRGRTALVDFDLRGGDLASYCGTRVRHSLIDLVPIAAEIGGREVSEVAYPVRGGIELFPAPDRAEMSEEMTETAARQIVQALRYQYERIVIDCGSRLDDAMAPALDLADEIVVVSTPEVPALRAVRHLRSTMDRLDLGRGTPMRLLLNRSSRRAEIQPQAAARLAGVELLADLPDSVARLEPVLNTADILEADVPAFLTAGQAVAQLTEPRMPGAPIGEVPEEEAMPLRRSRRERGRGQSRSLFRRSRNADEAGGTTVEFMGVILIALTFFFLCLQFIMLGSTALLAHNSAQEAARGYAVGMSHSEVVAKVSQRLPSPLASRLSVSGPLGSTVKVRLGYPGAWPGLGPVEATAKVHWEKTGV